MRVYLVVRLLDLPSVDYDFVAICICYITGLRPLFPCPGTAFNRRMMHTYLAGFYKVRLGTWAFGGGHVA